MTSPLRVALTPGWPWSRRKPGATIAQKESLVARYGEALFQYTRRRVASDADAEDIAAETLAVALSEGKAPPENPADDDPTRAFLFGVARRKIAQALRTRTRRPEEALDETIVSLSPTPEGALLQTEHTRRVRAMLSSLPDEWHEVLLLKYVEGLSLAEIAVALERSEAAVSSLLQRARSAARTRILESEEI
jgi:RNA polymerase sigma-70 factor, ECF subfamily